MLSKMLYQKRIICIDISIKERMDFIMSNRLNYIAIALTTHCNCNCFYCKETGESIIPSMKGTWDFDHLKMVIKVAYSVGLTTFRITGGEPTMVEYLPDLIRYIMDLGENTKIRLNTPKYLSPKVEKLATELVKRQISTRFNIVVTKYNYTEVECLIEKSLKLGVNIKILDLIIRNEYLGNYKKLTGKEAFDFGESSYQLLDVIKQHLSEVSDNIKENHYISNSNGIPMSGYFFGQQWIQVKDSSKGAQYSKECKKCPYYNSCYEGVFSPLLSVGEVLHISGCMNQSLYYNLKDKSENEVRMAFEKLLELFENI